MSIDMKLALDGIKRFKSCKVKADKDDSEQKTIHLTVDFSGSTLEDVIEKAMSSVVIQYQSSARRKFDDLVDGQRVEIKFKAPSRVESDPIASLLAKAPSMTEEERAELIAKLSAIK